MPAEGPHDRFLALRYGREDHSVAKLDCVNERDLQAFLLGLLPERLARTVSDHLDSCPECEVRAGRLDRRTDPVLRSLRRVACPGAAATEALSGTPVPFRVEPPAVPEQPPRTIGDYEVIEELGRGGSSVVYKARQAHPARLVALKMILTGSHAGAERRARLLAEADAIARLQHPNIVQIYEVGQHDGLPFLALEYIAGDSLAHQLGGQPQPPREAAALVETLARAMHYAHERGVVHRDLKPANVLVQKDEGERMKDETDNSSFILHLSSFVPKITDFGLAKQEGAGLTTTGAVLGTPAYMAPEQAAGDNQSVGPAADLFALGAILYELLTGRPPFAATTLLETLEHVRTLDPVPPRSLQPGVPRDLEIICLKCLEKNPADRYADAEALAGDVRNFLNGEPIRARPPSFLDVVYRNLARSNVGTDLRTIGLWMILMAPVPGLLLLTVHVLFQGAAEYPALVTAASGVIILAVEGSLLLVSLPVLRPLPGRQRRHFITCITAEMIGAVLVWLVLRLAVPADRLDLMYIAYPLWTMHIGTFYFAFAAEVGWFYPAGAVFFVLPLVMVFFLPWMPLVLGVVMFCNMTVQGSLLRLRRGTGASGAGG